MTVNNFLELLDEWNDIHFLYDGEIQDIMYVYYDKRNDIPQKILDSKIVKISAFEEDRIAIYIEK